MEVKMTVNDRETLEELKILGASAVVEAWSEAVMQLARKYAEEKITGNFGKQMAATVKRDVHAKDGTIYVGGKRGYIAEAVENGGVFRSHNGKLLALPLTSRFRKGGEFGDKFPRNTGLHFLKVKSKRGNTLLFEKDSKGRPTGPPAYLLRPSFTHRPRPWWPTEQEAGDAVKKYMEENF